MQADNDLLKKGYRVELIHNFDYYRYRFYDEMYYCPELRAKLAAYDDQRMDGRFFFGGLAGAGQLESGIVRSYWSDWDKKTDRPRAVGKKFWSSQTYRNEYESMNVDLKACYLHYHNLAQRYWRSVTRDQSEKQSRRYNLQIRVLHFCTERGMRESIKFDVAIGPDQVPEGVYEDKGILIELDKKRLVRTSGQVLCAYGAPNCGEGLGNGMMEVKQPEKRPEMNQFKTESSKVCGDNNYARSRECPLGHICHDLDLVCKFGRVHVRDSWFCTVQHDSTFVIKTIFDKVKSGITNDDEYDREFECKPVVMNKTWNANPEDECGGKDQLCYEDEYCYYDYESSSALHVEKSECRKLRYRLLDEPCFITDECVPGAVCHREAEYYLWGRCAPVSNYYQCPFRTRQNTCRVSRCPHGSEQQEGCVKPSKPEEAKCPMKTMRDYDRGNIPECAVDNGVIKFLKGCAEIFDFSKILDFTRGCAGTLFNVVKQNCCKP